MSTSQFTGIWEPAARRPTANGCGDPATANGCGEPAARRPTAVGILRPGVPTAVGILRPDVPILF